MGANAEAWCWLKLNRSQYLRGLKAANRDMQKFRRGVNQELKKIAFASAATAAVVTVIGARYEQSMANVASVAGATAAELRALGASAREMGASTAFSAQQAAEAQYALVSSGQKVHEVISSLPGVMTLAGATQADLASSAEIVTGALNAFHLSAKETNRVVNVFAAGIKTSPLTMQRLGESFSYASSTAATLGISIEETVATLGALHKANIRGGQAGTYFRAILLNITAAMNENKGAIGAALQGWDAGTEGIVGAMQRLEQAGVTGATALSELGIKGGPALAALLNQGAESVAKLKDSITGTNQAFIAYQRQLNNVTGDTKIMLSTFQEAALRVYDTYKGKLREAIQAITATVRDNFDKITAFARKIVAAIEKAVEAFVGFGKILKENSEVVKDYATIIGTATVALYAMATAITVVKAALAITGIGVVIGIIALVIGTIANMVRKLGGLGNAWVTLVTMIKLKAEEVKTVFRMLWEVLKLGGKAFSALRETASVAIFAIPRIFRKMLVALKGVIGNLWDLILGKASIEDTWDNVKDAFAEGIEAVKTETVGRLKGIWDGLKDDYDKNMAIIKDEHAANMQKIIAEGAAALKGAEKPGGAGAGAGAGADEAARALSEHELDINQGVEDLKVEMRLRTLDTVAEAERAHIEATTATWIERTEWMTSLVASLYAEMGMKAKAVYAGMQEFGTAAMEGLSAYTERAIRKEAVMRMQLGKVAEFAAKHAAAAGIEALVGEAKARAKYYGALALGLAALKDWGGAAKAGASAAAFGLMAGVGSGLAAAMRSEATEEMERAMAFEGAGPAGGIGEDSSRNYGGRSTMTLTTRQAPETVNIYISANVYGNVVGDSGMEELMEQYFVPRLRALQEGGVL